MNLFSASTLVFKGGPIGFKSNLFRFDRGFVWSLALLLVAHLALAESGSGKRDSKKSDDRVETSKSVDSDQEYFNSNIGDPEDPAVPFHAYKGGSTDIYDSTYEDNFRSNKKYDIPTGSRPSPLFGAEAFTQPMFRFEEFGPVPLPEASDGDGQPLPVPPDAQGGLDPVERAKWEASIDDFLVQPIVDPYPTRKSNTTLTNPYEELIEEFLGRDLKSPPCEGRPGGEDWAHQRWTEFYPEVVFQTIQAGSRTNSGVRDHLQMHKYEVGEWAEGGLYHNGGTTAGTEVRFHPAFPLQDPESLWTFDGTVPPKLLMAKYGEPVLMRHYNGLPVDPSANRGFGLHTISTHEHNGHNPAESDGYANAFFFPGQFYDYRWPMILAGHDSINKHAGKIEAYTPDGNKAGTPDGFGGITPVPGDWRETMSTHWFHDHMLDFTAQNVYKGNASMFNMYSAIDRGNEAIDDGVNLRIASGTALDWGNRDYDVQLELADKSWDEEGQLFFNIFNLDGFLGDRMLTNWCWNPFFDVRARKYRFRILNASVSRYMKIAMVREHNDSSGSMRGRKRSGKSYDVVPFYMIANDGNLMEHAVYFPDGKLPTQAIAERYDILVDFSDYEPGTKIYMVNLLEHRNGKRPHKAESLKEVLSGKYRPRQKKGRWRKGDPCVEKFLEFRVHALPEGEVDNSMDPAEYVSGRRTMIRLPKITQEEIDNAIHRTFEFGRSSGTDSAPWTIKTDGGKGLNMDPRRMTACPTKSRLEIWHLINGGGGWSHPIHIHFEEGQILQRDGKPPPEWEKWARKDLYRVGRMSDSGRSVVVALRFREFLGTYMEHCHNTQHEDHAMLMRWDIENPGELKVMPTPLPSWDGCTHVPSYSLPTAYDGELTDTEVSVTEYGISVKK